MTARTHTQRTEIQAPILCACVSRVCMCFAYVQYAAGPLEGPGVGDGGVPAHAV